MKDLDGREVAEANDVDLDRAVRVMTAWIRDTDSFTQVVARWLQSPVDYSLLSQERREIGAQDSETLELPAGATALHRHGLLQAALPGSPMVLANVRATLVENRLPWSARQSVESGTLPLGMVLGRYEVRRHTHSVTRTCPPRATDADEYGLPMLRVRATLTTAGRLVAVVDETVYHRLLARRRALPVS